MFGHFPISVLYEFAATDVGEGGICKLPPCEVVGVGLFGQMPPPSPIVITARHSGLF